jgi:hypothetical protein
VVHLQDALTGAILRRVVGRVELVEQLLDALLGFALGGFPLLLLRVLRLFLLEFGSSLSQTALVRLLGRSASGAPRLTLLG